MSVSAGLHARCAVLTWRLAVAGDVCNHARSKFIERVSKVTPALHFPVRLCTILSSMSIHTRESIPRQSPTVRR